MGVELTVAQRTICLVAFDRYDPIDLDDEHSEMARLLFGDVDVIPETARRVLGVVLGARSGKSAILSALYSLWRMLTADLSMLAPGESAFAVVVAPDTDTATQVLNFLKGRINHPEIAPLVDGDPGRRVIMTRADGAVVEFTVRSASRGGARTRGRTYVSAVLDEACFFRDPSSGVVNDKDVFDSVQSRVIADGMVVVPSTPWMESGLLWSLFNLNFGSPQTAIVAHAPTLLMREGGPEFEAVEAMVRTATAVDEENARREYGAEFVAVGGGFYFSKELVSRSVLDIDPAPKPGRATCVGSGGDLALVRDSAALVVVHKERDSDVVTVAEIVERRPQKGAPLKLSSVVADFAETLHRHGALSTMVDQHSLEPAREHADDNGVTLNAAPGGNGGNLETFTAAREIIHTGRLWIPREYQIVADQLKEIVSKPLPGGGISFVSPRRSGRHGDVARALILALWDLEQGHVDYTLAAKTNENLRNNPALHSRFGPDARRPRQLFRGMNSRGF